MVDIVPSGSNVSYIVTGKLVLISRKDGIQSWSSKGAIIKEKEKLNSRRPIYSSGLRPLGVAMPGSS